MAWLNPPLQKLVDYRDGDTIISVPAKSGTHGALDPPCWSGNSILGFRPTHFPLNSHGI
jgi:hypothetical protein